MDRLRYVIGLVTLGAVLFGGWYLTTLLADEHTVGQFWFRLEFRDVRGLKVGADVRYRGVAVGSVQRVDLSDDTEKGVVHVRLVGGAEQLARHGSRFWIVTPRFGGLTGDATGLDTLVRDSYVAFLTPDSAGPQLAPGSFLAGLERPYQEDPAKTLPPIEHGDLVMSVLVGENHGLEPGAEVTFRGVAVGDVRSVALASAGTHVEVVLRIRQSFRSTVTDQSLFWIARPRLSGALLSGLSVEDLDAILRPFVSFYTPPGNGLPVPDGYRTEAARERPQIDANVPGEALEQPIRPSTAASDGSAIQLVQVSYEAVEEDWLSANDLVKREGTGIVFLDRDGNAVVLTTRSLCDATYFIRDAFGGDPDVERETIRVSIPAGPVLRAGRTWVAPGGEDVAILLLEDAPPTLDVTRLDALDFEATAETEGLELLLSSGGDRQPVTAVLPALESHRGAAVVAGDRAVGVLGSATAVEDESTIIPLSVLPAELRPRQ